MANEIELKEKLELSASDIKAIRDYEEAKARYSMVISKNDELIKAFMKKRFEETGETTFNQDGLIITYKKPYVRKSVDTEKLKAQGLYDNFIKETDVAESINVKVSYDD